MNKSYLLIQSSSNIFNAIIKNASHIDRFFCTYFPSVASSQYLIKPIKKKNKAN